MHEPSVSYGGDDGLTALLQAQDAGVTAADARAVVEGVVAAPPARDGDAWMTLICADPAPALREQLAALRREVERANDAGFTNGPAPKERIAALRQALEALDLSGFVVPRTDEYQGEYVPARAERLRWLTGFSGSAGLAVILRSQAAIFVDGRYVLQVRQEIDPEILAPEHITETPPMKWAAAKLARGERLGIDPWLHSKAAIGRWREVLYKAGITLVELESNPIDAIWTGQPSAPVSPIRPHPADLAGASSAEKREQVGAAIVDAGADAAVITAPDSVAWLLNVRGADVPRTPLPLSYAVVHGDGLVDLYVDMRKVTQSLAENLGNEVAIHPQSEFSAALQALGKAGRTVLVDPAVSSAAVFNALDAADATVVKAADPCALPKACKTPAELDGARAAHRRDATAVTRFLAWVARDAVGEGATELSAAAKLEDFRAVDPSLRDLSFDTISGVGSNGAITHYRVNERTDRPLKQGEIYLVDSGGQYPDGTTDVTRTVALGPPDDTVKDRFTRVLKGHIAIATLRFPDGTSGSQIDALARHALWKAGLDYDHGTGHGVGSYLGVHEGPQRISKVANTVALKPGMIVSNEPGYYLPGHYGIRIENLVAVRPCEALTETEKPFYEFETLTLVPIDRNLVAPGLLTADELAWLNDYHARVRAALLPDMDAETREWLLAATEPLSA